MKTLLTFLFITIYSFSIIGQNVGIDVLEPSGKLHIKSNSGLSSPQLRLTEEGNDFARFKMESDQHPEAYWDIAGRADTLTENSLFNFYFHNNLNSGDRLTIRGNGNIGINNTSPTSKLDIRNIGDGAELLRFTTDRPWVFKQTSSGAFTNLTLQSTINSKIFNIVSGDSSLVTAAFKAHDFDPATYLVPTIGKVGIGTYNPVSRLGVDGSPTQTEDVMQVNSKYLGQTDVTGIDCNSFPATGYGVGANFRGGYRGVRGLVTGGTSQRMCIGVVGAASGENNQGTRVGVWGDAYGSNINWAGYFDNGNVYVRNDLRIGSGAINGASGYRVAIDGKVIAEEVRVQASGAWPDYVFEEDYDLQSINSLEKEIEKLGHLPGVPSAQEVEEGGIILGEMQKILLEKVEELTLYTIDLQKQVESLKAELHSIKVNK